jgi:putative transposase
VLTRSLRKEMVQQAVSNHVVSIRLACLAFSISETCYRYQEILVSENEDIADRLIDLREYHSDWGFGLCFDYLRNVKGFGWNHKRVYRIDCD